MIKTDELTNILKEISLNGTVTMENPMFLRKTIVTILSALTDINEKVNKGKRHV